jgi:hypothetical protein
MNSINLAEKFLAYDGIYDAQGSNFNEIYPNTIDMLYKCKENIIFGKYIDELIIDIYKTNVYNCSKLNGETIRKIMNNNYSIIL